MGASRLLRVTSALCHPPSLINALCGALRHTEVPAALTVASPSYWIYDGPPTPLLLAWLWHLKCATLIASSAWWPGASALGIGHLPRCPDLVVWALAYTYRALVNLKFLARVWALALRPLSPLPLLCVPSRPYLTLRHFPPS